MLTATAKFVL